MGRTMRRLLIILAVFALTAAGLAGPAAGLQPVAQDNTVSMNPGSNTPNVLDGEVDSIAQVGQWIVLGGSFTQVQAASGGPVLTRNSIVAFDKDTGAISTTFHPSLDGGVKSVTPGPAGSVYVGGAFGVVDGNTSFKKITRLNVSDGSVVGTFRPKTVNAIVRDVQYASGRLFIGGEFTAIGGVSRLRLAELDPTTGALLPSLDIPLEGTHFGGSTQVYHMDVSPDGTQLVIAGNFTSVGGLPRVEVAKIDLSTSPATVSDWQTSRFETQCYSVFKFIVRDIEFSPDGSYFAIATTGGYGPGSPSMCDSVSRWESNTTGPSQDPTWIDYTGGDSTYTVALTGSTVYVGGHMRWENNPSRADAEGPGAVARQGLAALDPVNGLPLSWDPGRVRGQGVFAMLATTDGLYIGSDTDQVHGQYHAKVAFFPLARGSAVPQPRTATLPVSTYALGDLSSATTNVLYRVNAGGPAVPSQDGGPDWSDDSAPDSALRNSGSNTAGWSPVPNVNSSVPNSTPSSIFDSERWDPSNDPEMQWHFPVAAGTHVQVRLLLANRCGCTSASGQRSFDVSIDGTPQLSNYDIVADAGDQTGEMKSFNVTSDGSVDIEFAHRVENPLVNGIELVNLDAPASTPGDGVVMRSYDGSTVGSPTMLATGGVSWSDARGAFLIGNDLYTAWSDGHLYKRTFDGNSFGAPTDVNLNGLTNFSSEMRSMTGLFYDHGRIYYTLAGSSALYMRYFSVQNDVVGAGLKDLQPFKIADNLSDVDWAKVRSMTLVGNRLYWANRSDASLHRVDFVDGQPVSGTDTTVSGPAVDGNAWTERALFVSQAVANQPPVASFTQSCTALACSFDGTASSDAEGPVTYRWDFGDGTSSTLAKPDHTFAAAGTYHVVLSVTDQAGATSTASRDLSVAPAPNRPPTASFTYSCTDLSCTFDGRGSFDPDGQVTSYAWDFGDGNGSTSANPSHTFAAGTYTVKLTVTDDSGAQGQHSGQVTVSATQAPVSFVASVSDSQTGSTKSHSLTVPASVRAGDSMVLYFSDNAPKLTITPPAGWTQVGSTPSGGMLTRIWSKTATGADVGSAVKLQTSGFARGVLSLAVYRNAAPVTSTDVSLAAEGINRAAHTTPSTTVGTSGSWVASMWSDKTASTTAWMLPANQTQRQFRVGTGAGHVSMLLTDGAGPVPTGSFSGLTATADSSTASATMATVVLRPGG